eukprot:7614746-Ditylum_brightwellii.AAC.1
MDTRRYLHGEITPPSTYQHGHHQIDYIFIKPGILPTLRAVGFLSFNEIFSSDIYPLFADVDREMLFLGDTNNAMDPATRKLVYTNSKSKKKYCDKLQELFSENKILKKLQQLHYILTKKTIPSTVGLQPYDAFDDLITKLMLYAQNECRRSTQGHTWSVKVVAVAQKVQYWKTCGSNLRNACKDETGLLDLGKSLDIPYNDAIPSEIDASLTKAGQCLKEAQKNTAQLQNELLEDMVHLFITSKNTDLAKIIKNIHHRMEVKDSFASL